MDRRETAWFKEIPNPNSSFVCNSVDYLDRLIGGREQKQFLFPPKRESNRPDKQQKKNPPNANTAKIRRGPQTQAKVTSVELDDAKWLEERKKRFPKAGADREAVDDAILSAVPDSDHNHGLIDQEKETSEEQERHLKSSFSSKQRKKTLFEKLLDSN